MTFHKRMKFSFQFTLGPWVWGALFVLAAIFFIFFQARVFLLPPRILLLNLPVQTLAAQNSITLYGRVYNAKELKINGKKAKIAGGGRFEERLQLWPGLNIIVLRAVNYLGKETVVRRYILMQAPSAKHQ